MGETSMLLPANAGSNWNAEKRPPTSRETAPMVRRQSLTSASVIVHLPISTSSMALLLYYVLTRAAASARATSIAPPGWAQVPGRADRSAQPDQAPGTRG